MHKLGEIEMRNNIFAKIFVTVIIASIISVATVSNGFTVLGQEATLDDVITELETLNDRLDNIEENVTDLNSAIASLSDAVDTLEQLMYALSATTASASEVARFDVVLDNLADMVTNAWSITTSLNATTASKLELAAVNSTVDELQVTLESLSEQADDTERYLKDNIELLKILVAIALVLALVSAVAAVVAVYIMRQKTKNPKTG
jgi:prefoldin subunit 5